MAGQRQKPREELAFKRGRGRMAVAEPVAEAARADQMPMPENIDLCEEARELWRLTVTELPHVAKREYGFLVRWITWCNLWWRALRELELEGVVEQTVYGSKLSTQFRALRECEMMVQRFETKLGLDPQSRMRLGLTAAKEQTALERLRGAGAERRAPAPIGGAR